jgi:hypothetical protein
MEFLREMLMNRYSFLLILSIFFIAAGPEFKILANNELDGSYTLASPAVSGSNLFIRTSDYLYCIGELR